MPHVVRSVCSKLWDTVNSFSIIFLIIIFLVVVIGAHFVSAANYVTDTFTRTTSGSWGSADVGGAWTHSGSGTISTSGTEATIVSSAGASRNSYLASVTQQDVDEKVKFKTDKLAVGGSGQFVYLVARRISSAAFYRAKVILGTDASIKLNASRNVSSVETDIGTNTSTGITHVAGTYYWVRTQISGVNPTTIKARLWQDGSSEPSTWTINLTDSQAELQTSGSPGIYNFISGSASNGPVTFTFDNYTVDSLSNGQPTISLTALSPDPNTDNTPALTGTGADPDGTVSNVEFQMDGTSGSWTACTSDDGTFDEASEAYTCTVSSALSDGAHTMYVRATDDQSTVSSNASDAFSINTPVTYYVDCSAGNDSNAGTSTGAAWSTLTKVNNSAFNPGDSILIKKGCTFSGQSFTISESGTAIAPITIDAYGSGALPITQNNPSTDSSPNSEDIITTTGNYITIKNIQVNGVANPSNLEGAGACVGTKKGSIYGIKVATPSAHVTVQNAVLTHLTKGVILEGFYNKILNSTFNDNDIMRILTVGGGDDDGAHGIAVHGFDAEVGNNSFSNNVACSYDYLQDGSSVELFAPASRVVVHHNTAINDFTFTELGTGHSPFVGNSYDNIYAYNVVRSNNPSAVFFVTRGLGDANWGPVYNTMLYNNTVYLSSTDATKSYIISCVYCTSSVLTMRNNIFWAEGEILRISDGTPIHSNNIYWKSNGNPVLKYGFTPDGTSQIVNPQFANVGVDLSILSNSPAINTGSNVPLALGFNTDINGNTVPYGATPDVGAYESTTAVSTYASDAFGRTSASSWGTADIGGVWTRSGGGVSSTNGSQGVITHSILGSSEKDYLGSVSQTDIDTKFKFKSDKLAAGGSQIVYAISRRVSSTSEYRSIVFLNTDQTIKVLASKLVGGTETTIGSLTTVTGVTHAANTFYWLRTQVTGTNPTTINIKVWPDGQSEPSTWNFTNSADSQSGLQTAGSPGIMAFISGSTSNAPVAFTFDDYNSTSPNASNNVVPTLSLTTLSPNITSDSTPSISGTATDSDGTISTVEFQIDSTTGTWSSCTATDGTFDEATDAFTCTPSVALSDGAHTLYARTRDNTTDYSINYSTSFSVDTTAPSVSLTALSPDPNASSSPALTGTATDAVGTVAAVEFQMDSTAGSWSSCTATDGTFDEASDTFTCTVSVTLSNASHTMYVRATDAAGNITSSNFATDTFTIDSTSPTISLTALSPDPNSDSTPALGGTAAVGAGSITGVEFQTDSVLGSWTACTANDGTFNSTSEAYTCTVVSALTNASHTMFVRATATGSRTSLNASDTFTIDTAAPSVSLTALSPDPTSDNTPSITGTATDASSTVSSVQFQIDVTSGSWTSCTANDGTFNSASEAFTCTAATLTDGEHTMFIRSTDSLSNTTASGFAFDVFEVDTIGPIAPSVLLTALSPDPNSDTTPTLSGTATDSDGTISTVEFQMDSTSGSWTACVATDGAFDEASDPFTCTASTLTNATHTMFVRATDNDVQTSANESDQFIIDTTAPAVVLNALSQNPTANTTPSVTGTATDASSNISSVQIQVDSTSGSWTSCTATDGAFDETSETFSCTVASALTNGSHTIFARSTDALSNVTASGFQSISFTVDITSPAISVTPLTPDPISSGNLSISGTATDASTTVAAVQFQIDSTSGTGTWTACTADDGTFDEAADPYTCSATGVSDGQHTMFIRARDALNNTTNSNFGSDVFVVDTTGPTIFSSALTPSSTGLTATWETDENSSTMINFGLSTAYEASTAETDTTSRVSSHTASITGLLACTKYYYQLVSKDTLLEAGYETGTFTTTGCIGSAAILSDNDGLAATTSASTISLLDSSLGVSLSVPSDFYPQQAYMQIKQLEKTAVLSVTSTPTSKTLVSNYIYDIKAFTATNAAITIFNDSITITMTFSSGDVSGFDTSTLRIHSWDGSSWSELSGCSVGSNTVSCTTTHFSIFGLFGSLGSGSSGNSSSSSSGNFDSSCTAQAPTSAPDLFQINRTAGGKSAIIYFAPASNPYNKYGVVYGTSLNDLRYGVIFDMSNLKGAGKYTISQLSARSAYHFKIVAFNGCQPGSWSSTLSTKGGNSISYKPFPKKQVVKTVIKK